MDKQQFIQANAPCYLYDRNQIIERCRELRAAIPQVRFLYSVKANPFPAVVETIAAQGFGADAASANEVLRAEQAGIAPERIFYSAPGKTERDIERTLQKCVLIADSLSELERIEKVCAERDLRIRVGIRVNPDFSMEGTEGAPSKFGIDEEQLSAADLRFAHLKITGIHVHLKSQLLDADTLCAYYEGCFALAERVNELPGTALSFINFGSGIGTVYDEATETPPELEKIGRTFEALRQRSVFGRQVNFILETGRYLVCRAGTYYTRIVDRKVSRGKTYLIVRNGMNGFFRPAVAELLRQNLGAFPQNGQEPLYTSGAQSAFHIPGRSGQEERVDIVGNLCTALDVLARDIPLPHAEAGDLLEVSNAGSYAYSLTPVLFSSQDAPGEYLWADEAMTGGTMSFVKTSRYISLILRHKPEAAGITLDEHGWANVEDLLSGINKTQPLTMEELEEIVRTDDKQRYSFNADKTLIRANQGHSVPVDVELEQKTPPEVLYHGTGRKYEDSIDAQGLLPKSRLYVHLSADRETAVKVGARHGQPMVYRVKSGAMVRDGYAFYLSVNGVWLTKQVPVQYLIKE